MLQITKDEPRKASLQTKEAARNHPDVRVTITANRTAVMFAPNNILFRKHYSNIDLVVDVTLLQSILFRLTWYQLLRLFS